MSLAFDGNVPVLWLADQNSGEAVKTTLDGRTLLNLQRPDIPAYRGSGRYAPTWVAVSEERVGGNGDVRVADGYGRIMSTATPRQARMSPVSTELKDGLGHFCVHTASASSPKPRGRNSTLPIEAIIAFRYTMVTENSCDRSADFLNSPCGFVHRNGVVYIPEFECAAHDPRRSRQTGYLRW